MPGGLLTRIKRRSQGLGDPSESAAIAEHLRALLNTRQGNSGLDSAYGLPDFTDLMHMFPRGIAAMCDGIARAVERFEPRLQNVEVEASTRDVDNLIMHFVIRAEIARSGASIRFDSSMNQSGHVDLR
jgi:type VI secretion system protein